MNTHSARLLIRFVAWANNVDVIGLWSAQIKRFLRQFHFWMVIHTKLPKKKERINAACIGNIPSGCDRKCDCNETNSISIWWRLFIRVNPLCDSWHWSLWQWISSVSFANDRQCTVISFGIKFDAIRSLFTRIPNVQFKFDKKNKNKQTHTLFSLETI